MSIKKILHPEGIPWPFSLIYNRVSRSLIFQKHYMLVAEEICRLHKSGSLLDIGTGPGWLLLTLKRNNDNFKLTGVDISEGMVHKALENITDAGFEGEIKVVDGRACDLPFPDSSFDIVVSTGSIHHWKEPDASMLEIYRVLKRDGNAYLYDIVKKIPDEVFGELEREYGRFRMAFLWLHSFEEPFYDIEEFRSLVKGSGLVLLDTHFTGALCSLHLKKE